MRKITLFGMILLILSGVIFFCFFSPATAKDPDKIIIRMGKNVLALEKKANGVISHDYKGDPGKFKHGSSLNTLGITDASVSPPQTAELIEVSDHTTFFTHDPVSSSPGCTYYFWGGHYWRVCD